MKSVSLICSLMLALCALSLGACVEVQEPELVPDTEAPRQESIVVQPEFSIEGVERLDAALLLEELGLSISEIRLEPLDSEEDIAYSFVRPQHLSFDIANGVRSLPGEPIDLPRAGRYLVSIRLEPVSTRDDEGNTQPSSSFSMSGQVATSTEEKAATGTMSEGPIPRPFRSNTRPKGDDGTEDTSSAKHCMFKHCTRQTWSTFSYHSERSVFYTIDEVNIVDGSQHLSFSFDIEAWGAEVAEPISRAVSTPEDAPILDERLGLDITRQLDSMGHGVDALIERASLRARPFAR
jgi:hypothetical protein